ncbi:MAG: hypothetical protein ABIB04_01475 [Patescibacteria group bacterium]
MSFAPECSGFAGTVSWFTVMLQRMSERFTTLFELKFPLITLKPCGSTVTRSCVAGTDLFVDERVGAVNRTKYKKFSRTTGDLE